MSYPLFSPLACPIDGAPLVQNGATCACKNGHSFDRAKAGYLNLLPVQYKRSLDPGDSKEMVEARHRFLEAGFYAPIADALYAMMSHKGALSCLDAGCGEGYYLRALQKAGLEGVFMGLDISKWAVQKAAKCDKHTTWVVGTNAHIPALDQSFDWVLCMFGFPVFSEFARVLKPEGNLIMVGAGPRHLQELKAIIYPSITEKAPQKSLPDGFTRVQTEHVYTTVTLTEAQAIHDLLAMTPHFYRATPALRESALALEHLTVTIDVVLERFSLTACPSN